MSRTLYITSFALLGLLLATIVLAGAEMLALQLIFSNPAQFADTIWWNQWNVIHGAVSAGFWLVGLVAGAYLGVYWWEPYGSKPGFYHWRSRA